MWEFLRNLNLNSFSLNKKDYFSFECFLFNDL